MKQNSKIKTMKASDLVLDLTANDRFHGSLEVLPGVKVDTYALPILRSAIVQAGQINVPLVIDGATNTVLQGNRRALIAQEIVKNPDAYPPELVANMNRIPVVVYDDLSPGERMRLIHDKGDRKGLGRAELLRAVWTLYEQNYSEAEIAVLQVYNIAKYTGNEKKLNTLPTDTAAREKAIKRWLHGTVGNYMLAGYDCGPRVRKCMLLTDLKADNLLPKDAEGNITVKPEWDLKRNHITDLVTARTEDANAGEWNSTTFSGPRFNAKLESYVNPPANPANGAGSSGEETTPKTLTELRAFDSKCQSAVAKETLKIAAGEKSMAFPDLDRAAARWEQVANLLRRYSTEFTDPMITGFVAQILGQDNLADLDAYLVALCQTPASREETEHRELVS